MRRRPPSLDTTRRVGDGLVTAGGGNAGAAAHIANYRSRRLRKCDVLLRRCVVVFMFCLTGVLKFEQYSFMYYLSWVLTYLSFFFILPSVLPSDTNRIRVMLVVTAWNMLCASGLAMRFATKKYREESNKLRYCNFFFWLSHSLLALYYCACAVHALAYMVPSAALHKFWRSTGYYFTCSSLLTAMDLLYSTHSGKYQDKKYGVAMYGNAAVTSIQFLIGRLCHSNRFKNFMWAYAAQIASIRQLPRRQGWRDMLRCDPSWIVTSVVLVYLLSLFSVRKRHAEPITDNIEGKLQFSE